MRSEENFIKFYQLITLLAENYFNPFIKQPQNVNLTKTGILIINFIGTRKECIIKEITETFKISPSTASEHIDRLHKTKYIFKHTPKDDQRKVVLSLTDKGLMVYQQYNETRIQFLREKFSELNEKEVKMLIKTLSKFQMNE